MSGTQTEQDKHAALTKIINGSHSAFMVTRASDGTLHGRPMATAKVEGTLESLWFASERNSPKVRELDSDDHVFLGYSNASGSEWASINGHARVVSDRQKVRQLWSPVWKNWFSGPDDPNLVLIRVTPVSAEYWDNGSKALAALKFAYAAVTGQHVNEGKHERVSLS